MNDLPILPIELKNKKVAIFYSFLKVRGGAEKLLLAVRDYYNADFFVGALNEKYFKPTDEDSFSKQLFNPRYKLEFLHKDSNIPFWYIIKRQLYFLFSSKINVLKDFDYVIFSGNVSFVQRRLKKIIDPKKTKLINYCHTPPRQFTDQLQANLKKIPYFFRWMYLFLSKISLVNYKKDLLVMDKVITNSLNIKNRLAKYLNFKSDEIISPPIDINKFKYISDEEFFLSHSRLEEIKRIPLIVEAFSKMPEKKLIICSTGPLKDWLLKEISAKNLKNITYLGVVSDEKLYSLIGTCRAGILIPVDEDAGIVQCELMSAGKPVIGVQEGGLLETVIQNKTGILIPANPRVQDVVDAVSKMTVDKSFSMKEDCINQAKQFSETEFFKKFNAALTSTN